MQLTGALSSGTSTATGILRSSVRAITTIATARRRESSPGTTMERWSTAGPSSTASAQSPGSWRFTPPSRWRTSTTTAISMWSWFIGARTGSLRLPLKTPRSRSLTRMEPRWPAGHACSAARAPQVQPSVISTTTVTLSSWSEPSEPACPDSSMRSTITGTFFPVGRGPVWSAASPTRPL